MDGQCNTNRRDVFVIADNVFSPLGKTTSQNFINLSQNISAVKEHHIPSISPEPFYAALFDTGEKFMAEPGCHTKFEQLLIASVGDVVSKTRIDTGNEKTILIIASTKGNIDLLETQQNSPALQKRIALSTSAKLVAEHFGFKNTPIVISNACISGVLAIITGMRLVNSGQYDNAIVTGADTISKFILSGFQSFQALANGICRPFDSDRDGLNLGEGAATVILSVNKTNNQNIKITGGGISNDANHISGPSRTGKELAFAIKKALQGAGLKAGEIDFISAHGTATPYNDEMEANAFALAGLQAVPVNSLKGYYGHTLGAAGLIELVISMQSMREGLILPTLGFEHLGVSHNLNIPAIPLQGDFKNCLKTASGFGGCNAAVVFEKR